MLTPAGFGIVLRLIGHYQAGQGPSPELALRPGPLPKFEGVGPTSPTSYQPPPGPPPSALQPQASGSGPIRVPPLTPDKASQYAQLFEKSGPSNGVLPGEQAKQIFERAGLPNEILGRIWNLADTEQRGGLVATEFVIAMHLIASFKTGQLRALPNVLPAGLYEAAARRAPSRQSSGAMSSVPRQFSGNQPGRTTKSLSRSGFGAPPQQMPQASGSAGDWAVSPTDKAKFDTVYYGLDRANKGYITGDEAVPFFSESKLPEEALAQIWDLADINSAGHLTRDEFAVAMYLIRQQRGKRDGRDSLPATLPQNLIPPSMRNQTRPQNLTTAPAFENPQPTLPKSAAEDLFGLDALTSPNPPSAPVQAQSTGGSTNLSGSRQLNPDPFATGPSPLTPTSTSSPQQSSMFKSFVPSSSFGQTLTQHATGGSNGSGPTQSRGMPQSSSATEDLLGDNDPEVSKKLTSETSELANLSNQVGNLSTKMQEVQGQRATSQNELTQASSQKRQFEDRLTQLRSLYEQEVKDVKALEERLAASRNETKKLQTEIAMLEGTYQDLQTQHRQTVNALQADQQENASLKEKMRMMNSEIAQMKPTLEKLRSDARQQKGLVAINKKQLATVEGERDKMKSEGEDLKKSIDEDTKTLAEAPRVKSPPAAASPTPSTMSATNPFFRRQGSIVGDMASSSYSSPSISQKDQSFDSVFGPSFNSANEKPPPVSRRDSDARSAASNTSLPIRTQSSGLATTSPPSSTSRDVSQASELPPPPESRQISSSYLPFPSHLHEESVSSSRQVSAPNSRFGDGSTGADTPTHYTGTTPTGSSTAGQVEHTRGASPSLERTSNPSPVHETRDHIPGAFPGDANSDIVGTPTGGSTLSEQAAADPFGKREATNSGNAKDDFDAAFAGFGAPRPQERSIGPSAEESSAPAGFSKEFPPIAELDRDDDSDSGSEHAGFEDDFAPASPGHSRKGSSNRVPTVGHAASGSNSSANDFLRARQGSNARFVDPPTPNAQASPPSYDKAIPASEQAHAEAQQFSGLLPSREMPASPEANNHRPSTSSTTPFGIPQVSSQPVPHSKAAFDDDFDEFDDLEDAKEGDADDDFANISAHSRSAVDDFNPMFDSPPTSSKGHDRTQHSQAGFGNSTSRNAFGDFMDEPSSFSQSTNANTNPSVTADSHDWDAIFAGLDGPTTSSMNEGIEQKSMGNGNATTSGSGGAGGSNQQPQRPQVGRALTDAGVHDDPILKNLTGMGYSRSEALQALEKYDYNLERVSSFSSIVSQYHY